MVMSEIYSRAEFSFSGLMVNGVDLHSANKSLV